ncbi:putative non-specific serine/threonine protein kinase [Rosa chinensis]|uniref:Putative non-specific serine/threonine protein kinase n=1 Tax=Rosa chinensis TaxID=74649 RepID=A0A2P6S7J1_ROSCH|nr:putative non-specific serine/threonine protein kinase [Rosa chinensis]
MARSNRTPSYFVATSNFSFSSFFTIKLLPAQLGNLSHLQVLKLDSNNLAGEIPNKITQLESLEVLDISWNDLNGFIPNTLASMSTFSVGTPTWS